MVAVRLRESLVGPVVQVEVVGHLLLVGVEPLLHRGKEMLVGRILVQLLLLVVAGVVLEKLEILMGKAKVEMELPLLLLDHR